MKLLKLRTRCHIGLTLAHMHCEMKALQQVNSTCLRNIQLIQRQIQESQRKHWSDTEETLRNIFDAWNCKPLTACQTIVYVVIHDYCE